MKPGNLDVEHQADDSTEGNGIVAGQKRHLVLPPCDQCRKTKWLSLSGVVLIWAFAVACIACAGVLLTQPFNYTANTTQLQLPSGYRSVDGSGEVYSLIITGCLTVCTESTGFIHDVCLRWNLFQERRLRWVTNLRLLSATKKVLATRWLSNLLYFVTLAMAYTASSQIFITTIFTEEQGYTTGTLASAAGLMTLGACLIVQAALSMWIYLSSRHNIRT